VLDIETAHSASEVGGWDFTSQMGLSCAVLYSVKQNLWRIFSHTEVDELRHILLYHATRITTWAGWKFDLPVIFGCDRSDWPTSHWVTQENTQQVALQARSRDLLTDVWLAQGLSAQGGTPAHAGWKLGDAAWGTLGMEKTGAGADAITLFQQGKLAELYSYCLRDVQLTWLLEQHACKYGYLINRRNKVVRFPRIQTLQLSAQQEVVSEMVRQIRTDE
jgi:hypothetical protein